MSVQNTAMLPANILTSNQYEERQIKANTEEDALGRDAFLQLFTTQLKNQNPLSPMDNEAFVAQLAQFSSLEAMKGVQGSMEEMAAESKTEKFLLGSNLLGKTLNLDGSSIRGGAGRAITAQALMPSRAESAVFSVYEASSGQLIHREEFENLQPGSFELNWDGTNAQGDEMPDGTYNFAMTGEKGGERFMVPLVAEQKITAVSWNTESQTMKFEIEDGRILDMAEIDRIQI
ncbi:MAG: flagellar hook capping FlgD N-terminal domain-containing protein [Gammaproteobacteria bacterium]|jgi:flagellar basal-body rod modification protein FlgD|nr:flagellar hook capping FlgD N-terminal domain-containing protein [Gammaproteobacteria bacterium]